jgi:hypothetical protein
MIEYEVQMYRRPGTLRKSKPTTESVETVITAYTINHLSEIPGLSILQVRSEGLEWKFYTVGVERIGNQFLILLDLVTEEDAKKILIKNGFDN